MSVKLAALEGVDHPLQGAINKSLDGHLHKY